MTALTRRAVLSSVAASAAIGGGPAATPARAGRAAGRQTGAELLSLQGRALVVGFHFSFPSMGYVEKDGSGYRLVPIAWNPAL